MKSRTSTSFVTFDVVYEDGTRSSNSKVSAITEMVTSSGGRRYPQRMDVTGLRERFG